VSDSVPVVRIVDDDEAFRTAIGRLLRAAGYQVRPYASAGDFLLSEHEKEPGCVLLDLKMPGPSGLDLQTALSRREDPPAVIFLTAHGDVPASVQAMKRGAVDFLTKPVRREALLTAVRRAIEQDGARRTEREEMRTIRERFAGLSSREQEVLRHVVAGRLNKQIASAIGTSERTVKAHRARVMIKMGVGSLAELVRVADRLDGVAPAASSFIA
jgi:FixJ family two-component response regulator